MATYLEQRESGKDCQTKTVPRNELCPSKIRFLIGLERLGRDTGIRPLTQLTNPSLKPLVEASEKDLYYEVAWTLNFGGLIFTAKENKEK